MSEAITPCVRGCTRARRHVTDCEDRDACDGCFPRSAEHGLLCAPCHQRFVQWITDAPAQVHLLRMVTGKASPNSVPGIVETTAKIVTAWRTSSSAEHPSGLYARSTPASPQEDEPVRVAAIDVAREIEDWISVQIEMLVEDYDAVGPAQNMTRAGREQGEHGRWRARFVGRDGEDDPGDYVWYDPPARYVIGSGARWLYAQIGRLEQYPHVGDLWGELGELMSRAHALAPWREEVAVLDGIECPECHRMGLVRYGGDDFVSCTRCNVHMTEERYWIWVKILHEERQAG